MIQIGSVTLSPTGVSGFVYNRLDGWYAVTSSKSGVRERPLSDGAFGIARDWRAAAAISVEGVYLGADLASAAQAKQALAQLGSGLPVTMSVTDPLGTTSRVVSVRDIDIPDDFGASAWVFSIDVIASDPSRYGPTVVTSTGLPTSGTGIPYPIVYPISYGTPGDSGRLLVSNPGTRESFSLLSVSGGLSGGFELTNVATGQVLRFERDIPLGGVVFVNPRTARAYLDVPANDVTGFLTRREWWFAPAGSVQEIQFNSIGSVSGTPVLSASTKPAY